MSAKRFVSSLARISDLAEQPYDVMPLPREQWAEGDYVVARVDRVPRGFAELELTTGRMAKVALGHELVGALGTRQATLEAVGSWRDVGPDLRLCSLTAAGLLGAATSVSANLPPLLSLQYRGHACRQGVKLTMTDCARSTVATPQDFACPTVLLVGTSMSSGKTTSGVVIVRALKQLGHRVVGVKLTGAGRYRDILALSDAGADAVYDFVDVGLPATVCPRADYEPRLRALLGLVAADRPDVVVAEAGASPLEPYNGEAVLDEIRDHVRCCVLCASDPYAVVGVTRSFDLVPDVVAGIATSTSAGIELVRKLTGARALNVLDPDGQVELEAILRERLG